MGKEKRQFSLAANPFEAIASAFLDATEKRVRGGGPRRYHGHGFLAGLLSRTVDAFGPHLGCLGCAEFWRVGLDDDEFDWMCQQFSIGPFWLYEAAELFGWGSLGRLGKPALKKKFLYYETLIPGIQRYGANGKRMLLPAPYFYAKTPELRRALRLAKKRNFGRDFGDDDGSVPIAASNQLSKSLGEAVGKFLGPTARG